MDQRGARFHYAWTILIVGTIGVVGALGFGRFAYTPILPAMKEGLSLNYDQMGWIGTANFTGYLIFSVLGGYMATRFGSRRVISIALLLAGASLFLTGLSDSFEFAMAMRFLTGAGSAGSNVPIMALASPWFAARRRGMATGILASGSSVGLFILGPLIPYLLLSDPGAGWRMCWYTVGALTLSFAVLSYLFLRDRPEDKNLKPIGGTEGFSGSSSAPFAWKNLYTSRRLWHLAGVFFTFGFSYIIFMQFFSAFLVNEAGLPAEKAGNYLLLVGTLSIFCGPVWGTVSDFIGRKYALALVLTTQAACYLLFGLATSPGGYLVSTVLFGLTAWSVPSIMAAAVGDTVGARLAAAALGFTILIMATGQALAPPIAGKIADVTGTFTPAFILSAVVAFAGAMAALRLAPLARKD